MSGDAFVGLQRIKFLNLEGNSIKAIGGNTLAHLSGCIILDLRNDLFYPSRKIVRLLCGPLQYGPNDIPRVCLFVYCACLLIVFVYIF